MEPETRSDSQSDSDVLLDLGEPVRAWAAEEDEFVLDLDEEPVPAAAAPMRTFVEPQVTEAAAAASASAYQPEVHSAFADTQEVPFALAAPSVPEVAAVEPEPEPVFAAPQPVASAATTISADQLTPEMIDAIARRVVEMMSDKVVREIAWEVVPDLAELLIKQQLEKTK